MSWKKNADDLVEPVINHKERKFIEINDEDDDDDDNVAAVSQPLPKKKSQPTKITSHGMTTYRAPPALSGVKGLTFEQFTNTAPTFDANKINDYLATQQAFVDGTLANLPRPPPLPPPILPQAAQPQPPPSKSKAKQQAHKRKSETKMLKDINLRLIPSDDKRKRKPNTFYTKDL